MTLDLRSERGIPVDEQQFDWRDLVRTPLSKLDDDAFTRARVLLMAALERQAIHRSYAAAAGAAELRAPLARIRRIEQHQRTLIALLISADQSPLEVALAGEQMQVEIGASLAQREPDPALGARFRFTMIDDVDHLYRVAALLDRLTGMDPNHTLQSQTDIVPGRPTSASHRRPVDDLWPSYRRDRTQLVSKLHVALASAAAHQQREHYLVTAAQLADPLARQLGAELASAEEQHATAYESVPDPEETPLERWLLHEAAEVYAYWSCYDQESSPRVRAVWERFLAYELGQLHEVARLLEQHEGRDRAELLPAHLPAGLELERHRAFLRQVLAEEVHLRSRGGALVDGSEPDDPAAASYRDRLNASGSPSDLVAAGYRWAPGTELSAPRDEHGAEVTP